MLRPLVQILVLAVGLLGSMAAGAGQAPVPGPVVIGREPPAAAEPKCWEWRPGRTLFVVWQQSLTGTGPLGDPVGLRDVSRSVTAPGPNLFVVKTTFWLPLR